MTPLRIEAVYERIPQATTEAAVRWGFRASLDGGGTNAASASDAENTAGQGAGRALVRRQDLAAVPALRAPRHGPREAPEQPAPFPDLLGYGAAGLPILLAAAGTDGAGRGTNLDLFA